MYVDVSGDVWVLVGLRFSRDDRVHVNDVESVAA